MITERESLYNHYLDMLDGIVDDDERNAMQKALCMHYMRLQKPSKYYDDMHRHYVRDVHGGARRRMMQMMEDSLSAL